jgi:hypothetical protein
MVVPDRKTLVAFANLRGNPDFETVLAWVVSSRHDRYGDLESAALSDAALHVLRGEARAFGEIQTHADQARAIIERTV